MSDSVLKYVSTGGYLIQTAAHYLACVGYFGPGGKDHLIPKHLGKTRHSGIPGFPGENPEFRVVLLGLPCVQGLLPIALKLRLDLAAPINGIY